MTQIKQFRFYGENNNKTYPTSLTYNQLIFGNIFAGLGNITHLGIQAQPGTIFYLNGGPHPIMVGTTGIYELNLSGLTVLTAISFNKNTINTENGLIIDIIYDG